MTEKQNERLQWLFQVGYEHASGWVNEDEELRKLAYWRSVGDDEIVWHTLGRLAAVLPDYQESNDILQYALGRLARLSCSGESEVQV